MDPTSERDTMSIDGCLEKTMPRRPPSARSRSRSKGRGDSAPATPARGRRPRWILAVLAVAAAVAAVALARRVPESPARLRGEAERAASQGDWRSALRSWRAFNASGSASESTYLAEATAALRLAMARQAEAGLRKALDLDPSDAEAWKLLLEILRVEDRALDAQNVVWASYDRVPPESRPGLLRELTLALLADVPDDRARLAIKRWIDADLADVDARVALLRRMAAQPRAEDPDRRARIAELEELVSAHPDHPGAREALVTELADAGEPGRGRTLLDAWLGPEDDRDARYWRLRGRWALEYDQDPRRAAPAFRRALDTFPHDWRSWSGLARALARLGKPAEARQAAASVVRIREALEPTAPAPASTATSATLKTPRRAATSPSSPATSASPAWPTPGSPRPTRRPAPRPARPARPSPECPDRFGSRTAERRAG